MRIKEIKFSNWVVKKRYYKRRDGEHYLDKKSLRRYDFNNDLSVEEFVLDVYMKVNGKYILQQKGYHFLGLKKKRTDLIWIQYNEPLNTTEQVMIFYRGGYYFIRRQLKILMLS